MRRLKRDPLRVVVGDPQRDRARAAAGLLEHGERGVDAGQCGDLGERMLEQFLRIEQRRELRPGCPFAGDAARRLVDAPIERPADAERVCGCSRNDGDEREHAEHSSGHRAQSLPPRSAGACSVREPAPLSQIQPVDGRWSSGTMPFRFGWSRVLLPAFST